MHSASRTLRSANGTQSNFAKRWEMHYANKLP